MATLEVRLFGALHLGCDGQALGRSPGKRSGELLAYVLLNRHAAQPREQVAGLFWGEGDESKARHSLNTALWRLRGILEQLPPPPTGQLHLRVDARTVGFNTGSDYWLDVAEFESRCALADQAATPQQKLALYTQAVALYRADLLPDCYEDWCLIERERLRGLYLHALAFLVGEHRAREEYTAAIEHGRRILAFDPLREEIHRDLMGLHLAARQPAAALRQYRACADVLRRELGVEPMPETRALLARAMDASGGTTHAHRAPAPLAPVASAQPALTDTKGHLHEVARLIDQAQARLREAGALLGTLASGLGLGDGAEIGLGHATTSLATMVREIDQLLEAS